MFFSIFSKKLEVANNVPIQVRDEEWQRQGLPKYQSHDLLLLVMLVQMVLLLLFIDFFIQYILTLFFSHMPCPQFFLYRLLSHHPQPIQLHVLSFSGKRKSVVCLNDCSFVSAILPSSTFSLKALVLQRYVQIVKLLYLLSTCVKHYYHPNLNGSFQIFCVQWQD